MLPVIEKFMAAHRLPDVTVVADAGMISEANQKAIEAAGLSFILGMKVPDVPYQVARWKREHPGEDIPDGHVFVQPWPAGPSSKRRDQMIYYQFRADRARRTLRGIDEQVAKAAKAVAGLAPVKRNRFIALDGAAKSINRELEARARDLAGLKGYVTNLAACPDGTPVTSDFVIGSYHELWNIEKSFRMSKSDLRARPIYHRKRDSIEAHLTIVFAALAVTRFIETRTGWSFRKFVRTAQTCPLSLCSSGSSGTQLGRLVAWRLSCRAGPASTQPAPGTSCRAGPASTQPAPGTSCRAGPASTQPASGTSCRTVGRPLCARCVPDGKV
jgi:hypothetical protein